MGRESWHDYSHWVTKVSDTTWQLNNNGFSCSYPLPRWHRGKEPTCQWRGLQRHGFSPWVGKIPLKKEVATHSRLLAWEIPRTEELVGLQSMGSQRVGHN